MCTLAVYRRVSPLYPLVVVANRDEFLDRAAVAPAPWPDDARIVAGRDLVAGGTWLGVRVDGAGRVAGLLNRRPAVDLPASGPGERSRGLLCLEALQAPSLAATLERLDDGEVRRYGGFNLFLADLGEAIVLDNGDGARCVRLDTGLSVLTNLDVNDPRCPRLAGATRRFAALVPMLAGGATAEEALAPMAEALASHEDGAGFVDAVALRKFGAEMAGRFARVCVHAGEYGTRSSSMVFVSADGSVRYFHADGPPCEAAFVEVPAPQ